MKPATVLSWLLITFSDAIDGGDARAALRLQRAYLNAAAMLERERRNG